MSYVSFALALVKLIGLAINYLHDQKLISAGEAMAVSDALREQANDLKLAGEARASVPDRIRTDGVRYHDENERNE